MPPLFSSDGAIIYAVTHQEKILLVRDLTIEDPKWKMPGETIEPDEPLGHAFRRGLMEEVGLKVPLPKHTRDTLVLRSHKYFLQELDRRPIEHARRHVRYFFRFELRYRSKLISLGNKLLPAVGGEKLETQVFDIAELDTMPDFLIHQRPLLHLLKRAGNAQAA